MQKASQSFLISFCSLFVSVESMYTGGPFVHIESKENCYRSEFCFSCKNHKQSSALFAAEIVVTRILAVGDL